MKLLGLKDTPNLYRGDIQDSIDYIFDVRKSGPISFDDHFHKDVVEYLSSCIRSIMIPEKYTDCIVGYTVRVNESSSIASVSVYTNKSILSNVKSFFKYALNTRSQLTELRGVKNKRRDEYEYCLELDMGGDADYRGNKMISNGIFRLVILAHILAKVVKQNGESK